MRAVLQRVSRADVQVGGEEIARIDGGLLVLLGVEKGDGDKELAWMGKKIVGLRIFEDENEKMNLSVQDVGGSILLVSQFTLLADASKGRRPGFDRAAEPAQAEKYYLQLAQSMRQEGVPVQTGRFGADMKVSLCNDGPVTILLESPRP